MKPLLKSVQLLGHVFAGLVLAWALALGADRFWSRTVLVRWWQRRLLAILQVRVHAHGSPVGGAHLTVANHVSWLDIAVIGSTEDTRFVSKSEVRQWPVAGTLAQATRALYIDRRRGGSAALLRELGPCLRAGGQVTLFPEGTTTDGSGVQTFHHKLFSAAIEAAVPVQPVALAYSVDSRGRDLAPFIGDDDLLGHLLRLLAADGLDVELRYLPALLASEYSAEALAQEAERGIARQLVRARGQAMLARECPFQTEFGMS